MHDNFQRRKDTLKIKKQKKVENENEKKETSIFLFNDTQSLKKEIGAQSHSPSP